MFHKYLPKKKVAQLGFFFYSNQIGKVEKYEEKWNLKITVFQVELAARKENPVPLSWGVGEGGKETTDPTKVLYGGGLLPLGGVEVSGMIRTLMLLEMYRNKKFKFAKSFQRKSGDNSTFANHKIH